MKSFPWDAIVEGLDQETGYPIYDRQYRAEDFRNVLMRFFSNGIFSDDPTGFNVKAGPGMTLTVDGGACFINGTTGIENNVTTLMIPESDTTNPRIDTVVLRWDADLDVRNIGLYVKSGIPAQSPVRPELTRITDTIWELGICDILVPAGSVTVADNRITDTRLETERCGIVTPFAEFDTTSFFERVQAILDEYEDGFPIISKEQIDAVVSDENPESDHDVLSLTGMSYWWKFIKEAAGDKIETISEEEVIEAFTGIDSLNETAEDKA